MLANVVAGNSGAVVNDVQPWNTHKLIFEAMYKIYSENKPVDFVTLTAELDNKNLELISQINLMVKNLAEDILGLNLCVENPVDKQEIPENIKKLAELRWQAKLSKNWADADKYRNEITELGYNIVDAKDGYKIERK